jgi:hypothetical protein
MDNKASTPSLGKPVTTVFRFLPSGPPSEATKKAIRSHVMVEAKRKQRQQKILSLGAKVSRVPPTTFEESLCKCSATPPVTLASGSQSPDSTGSDQSQSRSVVRKQDVADSYKVCPQCHRVQFDQLSQQGQLKIIRWHTGIPGFLGSGCDPFLSTPKLPFALTPAQAHQFNDLKIQGAWVVSFLLSCA